MGSSPVTMTVLIGNSDNKLTQKEWAFFCGYVSKEIQSRGSLHFQGGASWDSPWQNACWVFEIDINAVFELGEKLREIREQFRQDSIAIIQGETTFI